MNILLLEDDVSLNKAIKSALEFNSYNVKNYFEANEVLEALNKQFDLYILDVNIPNGNGLELLSLIKNQYENAKVIIITSNVDLQTISKAYTSGCMDYLKKPFHLEELKFKIDNLNLNNQSLLSKINLKSNVKLSKKEKSFLTLLLENKGNTVTYQMIDEVVYQDKIMSLDGLRALVRRLRAKIDGDVVKNVVEEGYTASL